MSQSLIDRKLIVSSNSLTSHLSINCSGSSSSCFSLPLPLPLSPAMSTHEDSAWDAESTSSLSGSTSPQLSTSESSSISNSPRITAVVSEHLPSASSSPSEAQETEMETPLPTSTSSHVNLTLPPLHPAMPRPLRDRPAPLTHVKPARTPSPGLPTTPRSAQSTPRPRSALRVSTSNDDLNGCLSQSLTPPSPQSPLPSTRRVRISCDVDVQDDPLSAWERARIEPEMSVGQEFDLLGLPHTWTDQHIQPSALQKLRSQGDDAADEIIKTLRIPIDSDVFSELERVACTRPAEYSSSEQAKCIDFLSQYETYKTDIDFKRLASGQRVMLKYAKGVFEALLYSSLIGGVFTRDINQVLKSTGYLTPRHMKSGAMTPRTPSASTPSHNNKNGPITSEAAVAAVRKLSIIHIQQQLQRQSQSQHHDSPETGSASDSGSATPTHHGSDTPTPTQTPPIASSSTPFLSVPSGCPFSGSMSGTCPMAGVGSRTAPASERELKNTMRRIFETNQYLLSVMTSDMTQGTLQCTASRDSIRVRLLHARVRVMLARQRVTPHAINQEDMLVTLYSFSVMVLQCLKRCGITLSTREMDDVCYLWGYCGRLMGIHDSNLTPFFNSYEASDALGQSVLHHLIPGGVSDFDPDAPQMVAHMLQSLNHFGKSIHIPGLSWAGEIYHAQRCTQLQAWPHSARALGLPEPINLSDATIPWETRRQVIPCVLMRAMDWYVIPYIARGYDIPVIGNVMYAFTRWFLIRLFYGVWTVHFVPHKSKVEAAKSALLKDNKGDFHFGMSHAPTMDDPLSPAQPTRRSSLIRAASAVSSVVSNSPFATLSFRSLFHMFLMIITVSVLFMVGSEYRVVLAIGMIACASPMLVLQQRSHDHDDTRKHHTTSRYTTTTPLHTDTDATIISTSNR